MRDLFSEFSYQCEVLVHSELNVCLVRSFVLYLCFAWLAVNHLRTKDRIRGSYTSIYRESREVNFFFENINMSAANVLATLQHQVVLVRWGSPLRNGMLEHFRAALMMEDFHVVRGQVRRFLNRELFSTFEEVTHMEQGYQNEDGTELVVQCCLVLELQRVHDIFAEEAHQCFANDPSWIFLHTRTLEAIAYLRYRLNFIKDRGSLRIKVDLDLIGAAWRCAESSLESWQGLLLSLQMAEATCRSTLIAKFASILEDRTTDIPTPAATILLDFVSDEIHFLETEMVERLVRRLLELGASLLISRDGRPELFKRVPIAGTQWWLEPARSEAATRERWPTALGRLLDNGPWSASFKQVLSQHVCCNLDAVSTCRQSFPEKVPRLACIAARHVEHQQYDQIPPVLRFAVVKHRP